MGLCVFILQALIYLLIGALKIFFFAIKLLFGGIKILFRLPRALCELIHAGVEYCITVLGSAIKIFSTKDNQ